MSKAVNKGHRWRVVRRASDRQIVLAKARWCQSTWCKFRGLMLRPPLPPDEGLLFVYQRDSKAATTIHMLFMRYAIAVVWLAADGSVVDKKLAKPWRPAYAPEGPARYFIEADPALLDRVTIGDRLTFDEPAAGEGTVL